MSDIFISYARSTAPSAQRVAEALVAAGYQVWRDDELPAHRSYGEVIEERLKLAKAVVVIWSAEAAKSQWVQSEADRARSDGKLVQLTVDGTPLPMPFDRIQCAELIGWNGEADAPGWRKVAASVAALAGEARAPASQGDGGRPGRAGGRLSICVLPFANISDDAQQEYFSDGISEDIITDLSKVSALSVISRNTAFTFKNKSVEVKQIARQLGVTHVLEGSVRKAGARVRITAQLIDAAADDHVWAERYDRDLTDIFALQDEISEAIVKALRLRLLPEEKKAIEQRGTTNLEAYNLTLLARQRWTSGNAGDPRREETVLRLAGRAAEIDPSYARAWALIATGQYSLRFNRGRAGDDGLAAADKALELDASLAEPHAVKAMLLDVAGRGEDAFAEMETALRLEPESDMVNSMAGSLSYQHRRFEDAARFYAKAAALNENDFASAGMLLSASAALGDQEGAKAAARLTLARAEKVAAQDPDNGHALSTGVAAWATLGEGERAREWIDRALLVDPDNIQMRYNLACVLSLDLGDIEGAIALLGPVFEAIGPAMLAASRTDPDLDPIRGDTRFTAMIAAAEKRLTAG
ncbi:MAG TPA: TIR domain-containing protein [Caulobacteraceae bacterium]